ncbi:MAG: RluA family pseudouridine synthase [Clostridiales bacterium]|nr:RluA family pseudouridine synthase [Clostridiales bacterium]
MKEITINKNDAGQRIDKFLTKKFTSMPKSLLYKYVRTKRIKVNGKRVKENYMLNAGDILSFYIPDEFFAENQSKAFLVSRSDIKVCYEDENILIVDKEKGLICHSESPEGTEDTLIDRIKAYLYKKGEYDPENENTFSPSLCNRIDRNTQGLVIAAKNAEALRIMNEIIKNREIEKGYLAVSHGILKNRKGELVSYLEKNKEENKVYVKKSPAEGALTAKLEYEVIAENKQKNLSLLKINLKTGRTHQIRAQFAAEGHPILGDGKYAVNKDDRKMGFSSQALCSYSVGFRFVSDKGILNYLNGVTVKTEKPDFVGLFY